MMVSRVGVLLMHHGAPGSENEVPGFLARLTGGRSSPAMEMAYLAKFRRCGGSPQAFLVDKLAEALQVALRPRLADCLVTQGSLFGRGSIADAVSDLAVAGVSTLVAVVLVPQRSRATADRYLARLREAIDAAGLTAPLAWVDGWATEPHLVAAFASRVAEALADLPPATASTPPTIFTAHSLPRAALSEGDPFVAELQATAAAVAQATGLADWQLAYQSPGRLPGPWLGPFVGDTLRHLAERGERLALVVPIQFLFDNLETLYDLDVELRRQADALGIELCRASAPNDTPLLVAALAALVSSALP